jgi:hypothetical protein
MRTLETSPTATSVNILLSTSIILEASLLYTPRIKGHARSLISPTTSLHFTLRAQTPSLHFFPSTSSFSPPFHLVLIFLQAGSSSLHLCASHSHLESPSLSTFFSCEPPCSSTHLSLSLPSPHPPSSMSKHTVHIFWFTVICSSSNSTDRNNYRCDWCQRCPGRWLWYGPLHG